MWCRSARPVQARHMLEKCSDATGRLNFVCRLPETSNKWRMMTGKMMPQAPGVITVRPVFKRYKTAGVCPNFSTVGWVYLLEGACVCWVITG